MTSPDLTQAARSRHLLIPPTFTQHLLSLPHYSELQKLLLISIYFFLLKKHENMHSYFSFRQNTRLPTLSLVPKCLQDRVILFHCCSLVFFLSKIQAVFYSPCFQFLPGTCQLFIQTTDMHSKVLFPYL